jgi:hypothetical protein
MELSVVKKAAERTKAESIKPTKKKTMIGTEKKSSALKPKK